MARQQIFAAITATLPLILALTAPLSAGGSNAFKPEDKAAIDACLERAQRNAQHATRCIGEAARACEEQPDMGSTAGMRDCFLRENAVWDEKLNASFQQLLGNLSKKHGGKLRTMQRTWIKWRTEKCEMPYLLYEGGSIAGPLAAECIMETTALRAVELERAAIAP